MASQYSEFSGGRHYRKSLPINKDEFSATTCVQNHQNRIRRPLQRRKRASIDSKTASRCNIMAAVKHPG